MRSQPDLFRVKTEAELAMTQKLDCTNIQGYCDGRPIDFINGLGLFQMPRRVVA